MTAPPPPTTPPAGTTQTSTTAAPTLPTPALPAAITVTQTETSVATSTTGYPPVDTSDAIRTAAWTTGSIALAGVLLTAVVTWRLGRRTARAAERSAAAAEESATVAGKNAKSSKRSSRAAIAAVAVNRETASGVALRAEADSRAKRYQEAAAQLGHVRAAVRLAGVYEMARLADDWPEQRQSCVDVLCAYLRMPWPEKETAVATDVPENFDPGEKQVRKTINTVIDQHLKSAHPQNWSKTRLDLSGATLMDFCLTDCDVLCDIVMSSVLLVGECHLGKVKVGSEARLTNGKIRGQLVVYDIEPGEADADAEFWSWTVDKGAEASLLADGTESEPLKWSEGQILGRLLVYMGNPNSDDPVVILNHCRLVDGGTLRLGLMELSSDSTRGVIELDDMTFRGGNFIVDAGVEIVWGESNWIGPSVITHGLGDLPGNVEVRTKYTPTEAEIALESNDDPAE